VTDIRDSDHSPHCCTVMADHVQDHDICLLYVAKFREYGVRVLDGGSSYVVIDYCAWCGRKLASSLRDEWFERIHRLGLEPESAGIPVSFTADHWWRQLRSE
jgi:hypothetical protein